MKGAALTVGLGEGRAQVWPTSGCAVMDTARAELRVTAVGNALVALSVKVRVSVPFFRATLFPGKRPVTLTLSWAGPGAAGESLLPPPQAPSTTVKAAASAHRRRFGRLDLKLTGRRVVRNMFSPIRISLNTCFRAAANPCRPARRHRPKRAMLHGCREQKVDTVPGKSHALARSLT